VDIPIDGQFTGVEKYRDVVGLQNGILVGGLITAFLAVKKVCNLNNYLQKNSLYLYLTFNNTKI